MARQKTTRKLNSLGSVWCLKKPIKNLVQESNYVLQDFIHGRQHREFGEVCSTARFLDGLNRQ